MHLTADPLLSSLLAASQDTPERALAARYAPIIYLDTNEPFPPLVVGYTLFHQSGPSPSFRQGLDVDLAASGHPRASKAIEYAIWSDWDIGHLYELEHVWVYLDEHGAVVRGEASWHGDIHDMRHQGRLELHGDHLALYSEPGKHAFAPTVDWFQKRRQEFRRSETTALAGCSGVLITPYLQGQVKGTPLNHRLARSYLAQKAFEPSWHMSNVVDIQPTMLVPWPDLLRWMPVRVNDWLARLARMIPPSRYRFLRIGHRGAAAHAPHNTLAGLHKAAALGADMAEFDVQQTADGHTVLAHDPFLADAEDHIWPIRHSTLAQLQAIDVGEGERIPTLDQALATCQTEQLGAYIELKDGSAVSAVADALRRYDWEGQSIVGSFQPDSVAELKALAPHVETSILFGSIHLDAIQLAQSLKASYLHPCWERFPAPSSLLTAEWIARVRQADLGIICWHEERPAEIAALQRLGIDGICSDAPELLLEALP